MLRWLSFACDNGDDAMLLLYVDRGASGTKKRAEMGDETVNDRLLKANAVLVLALSVVCSRFVHGALIGT